MKLGNIGPGQYLGTAIGEGGGALWQVDRVKSSNPLVEE